MTFFFFGRKKTLIFNAPFIPRLLYLRANPPREEGERPFSPSLDAVGIQGMPTRTGVLRRQRGPSPNTGSTLRASARSRLRTALAWRWRNETLSLKEAQDELRQQVRGCRSGHLSRPNPVTNLSARRSEGARASAQSRRQTAWRQDTGTPAQNPPPILPTPPLGRVTIPPQKDTQGRRGAPGRVCALPTRLVATQLRPPAQRPWGSTVSSGARPRAEPPTTRTDRVSSPEPGSAPLLAGESNDPSPTRLDSVGGGGNVQAGVSVMGFPTPSAHPPRPPRLSFPSSHSPLAALL